MTLAKIMVPFLDGKTADIAFKAAAVLAKENKSYMDVVHVHERLDKLLPGGAYYPTAAAVMAETLQRLEVAEKEATKKLKEQFEERARAASIQLLDQPAQEHLPCASASWAAFEGDIGQALATRARTADLVVFGKSEKEMPPLELDVLERLLFQSARPVLVTHNDGDFSQMPKTALVAWDGGREAARAINASLPILRDCDSVIVAMAGDRKRFAAGLADAVAYLRLHNVNATHLSIRMEKGEDAEDRFLEEAKKRDADIIVMGAYSHARWQEVILGGFTRKMLMQGDFPLLITH